MYSSINMFYGSMIIIAQLRGNRNRRWSAGKTKPELISLDYANIAIEFEKIL